MRTVRLPRGSWSYDESGPLGDPGALGRSMRGPVRTEAPWRSSA